MEIGEILLDHGLLDQRQLELVRQSNTNEDGVAAAIPDRARCVLIRGQNCSYHG